MLTISNFQPCMNLIFIMVLKDVFNLIVCIWTESSSSLSEKKRGKREKGSLIFALFTYLNLKAIFFQVLFFKYKITTISTVYHLWYFKGKCYCKGFRENINCQHANCDRYVSCEHHLQSIKKGTGEMSWQGSKVL